MANHKILVVDDSKVIRMRVRDMLPQGNFEVLEAKDGIEGLNLIRQEHPNLIMLDFILPRFSGCEVFQELQKAPELQTIPLVLMSGRKEEVTDKLREPFEHFEFIEKPFETKQLVEAIKAAMIKAKRPRRQSSNLSPSASASLGANSSELAALNQKIVQMQLELEGLKKIVAQLTEIVKQKLN